MCISKKEAIAEDLAFYEEYQPDLPAAHTTILEDYQETFTAVLQQADTLVNKECEKMHRRWRSKNPQAVYKKYILAIAIQSNWNEQQSNVLSFISSMTKRGTPSLTRSWRRWRWSSR